MDRPVGACPDPGRIGLPCVWICLRFIPSWLPAFFGLSNDLQAGLLLWQMPLDLLCDMWNCLMLPFGCLCDFPALSSASDYATDSALLKECSNANAFAALAVLRMCLSRSNSTETDDPFEWYTSIDERDRLSSLMLARTGGRLKRHLALVEAVLTTDSRHSAAEAGPALNSYRYTYDLPVQ
jgi:hypothetical protein